MTLENFENLEKNYKGDTQRWNQFIYVNYVNRRFFKEVKLEFHSLFYEIKNFSKT